MPLPLLLQFPGKSHQMDFHLWVQKLSSRNLNAFLFFSPKFSLHLRLRWILDRDCIAQKSRIIGEDEKEIKRAEEGERGVHI